MFLDLAAIASDEFSQEYFKHLLGEFIYFFAQEKHLQVALTFCKHVLKFRHGLQSGLNGHSETKLEEILVAYLQRFGSKSQMLTEVINE
jgi:hypothetical protein